MANDNLTAEEKRSLLLALLEKKRKAEKEVEQVENQFIPPSSGQRHLWLLHKIAPNTTEYNRLVWVKISGKLDRGKVTNTFHNLMHTHQALSISFTEKDGVPYIQLHKNLDLPFQFLSLKDKNKKVIIDEFNETLFDLNRAPLWRAILIEEGEGSFRLGMCFHHTISDAVSISAFFEDFKVFYENGNLEPNKITLVDILQEQAKFRGSNLYKNSLKYWNKTYEAIPPVPDWLSNPGHSENNYFGHTINLFIDDKNSGLLRKLCRENNLTPFSFFISLYLLLYRVLSDEDDLAVGVPVVNRKNENEFKVFGLLANTIPFRYKIEENLPFISFCKKIQKSWFEAFTYSQVPYEDIIDSVRPERDLQRNPLFQTMFSLSNRTENVWKVEGLDLEFEDNNSTEVPFEMALDVNDDGKNFQIKFECQDRFFSKYQADNIAIVLEQAIHKSILDHTQLIDDILFSNVGAYYGNLTQTKWESIAEEILAIAYVLGEKDAIVYEGRTTSYREMVTQAKALAYGLEKENTPVHICLEFGRHPYHIIGILGVMLSGRCFIPIDPALTDNRKKMIFDVLKDYISLNTESIDKYLDIHNSEKYNTITFEKNRDCYIVFTSGTTGTPKGVQVKNDSLNNYIQFLKQKLNITKMDSVLQFSSINFDTSLEEIF